MSFIVEWQEGDGTILERAILPVRELVPFDDTSYPYLRLVDPYSKTVFSSYQMIGVLPELEHLQDVQAGKEEGLVEITRMAQRCREEPHSVLVFHGD